MSRSTALPAGLRPGGRANEWSPRAVDYVVCDVDGTLIGPHDHASAEVVDAVARAQAAGVRVGIATGRMRDAAGPLAAQLGALGPHVFHNGAEVHADGATVATWTLEPDQIDALLAIADRYDGTYVEIYTDRGFSVSAWDERARRHWDILATEPAGVVHAASELDGEPVLKATFALFDPELQATIEGAVADVGLLAGTAGSPRTPELSYVNATHPQADKGNALSVAARHLGVELSRVAAIGDAANDLSMLAVAGTAIAMGQAPAAVQEVAHLVVPAVDDHGVAVAVDALVAWRRASSEVPTS